MSTAQWPFYTACSSLIQGDPLYTACDSLIQGGTHINYVVDQVVSKLLEAAKKKNKGGMDLRPMHVKSHLWVFVNCLIENPSFDSQTKENMTLKVKSFGSTCPLSDKFIKAVSSY